MSYLFLVAFHRVILVGIVVVVIGIMAHVFQTHVHDGRDVGRDLFRAFVHHVFT